MADEKKDKKEHPKRPRSAARALKEAELELATAQARYTSGLLKHLTVSEQSLTEAQMVSPEEDANWVAITGASNKTLAETRDPNTLRKQMYRFWRYHPHARGIIRNFVRFIVGPGFGLDMDDTQRGHWDDEKKKTKVVITSNPDDDLAVDLVWQDFTKRNTFTQRAKEIAQRTFRDGDCFVRKFERRPGRVDIRFVEPERITSYGRTGTVQAGDLPDDDLVGEATKIEHGVEYLATDIETVVAYHVSMGTGGGGKDGTAGGTPERVPARDMIHCKPLADANDLRGIPLLEVIAKRLTHYDQWEEYRMVLNKVRTAVALVRKVTGTSSQAEAIIRNRMSPRLDPRNLEPQTASGHRETMFRPGTTLTPSPGVEYDFIAPNLQARDASEDGRRIQMSMAAGVGLPEMMVTGDWSNGNFASSVEARTPAVREWQDWQDFFTPIFTRIFEWVVEAAIAAEILPDETSDDVTLQWPPLVEKDAGKETDRYVVLNQHGLLSLQTWSALENLEYEAEQENRHEEQEGDLAISPAQQQFMAKQQQDEDEDEDDEEEAVGTADPKTGKPTTGKPKKKGQREREPAVESKDRPKTTTEGLLDLVALREEMAEIDDPLLREAMERYVTTANRLLLRGHAPTPPRHARARR